MLVLRVSRQALGSGSPMLLQLQSLGYLWPLGVMSLAEGLHWWPVRLDSSLELLQGPVHSVSFSSSLQPSLSSLSFLPSFDFLPTRQSVTVLLHFPHLTVWACLLMIDLMSKVVKEPMVGPHVTTLESSTGCLSADSQREWNSVLVSYCGDTTAMLLPKAAWGGKGFICNL